MSIETLKAVNNKNPNKTLPVDINDLVQTGVLGMIALRKYDPIQKRWCCKRVFSLTAVAYWWVWQAMTGLFDFSISKYQVTSGLLGIKY